MANWLCRFVQIGHLKKLTKPFFNWGGVVGGTRYKSLIFCTTRSPQFNCTHHWVLFMILLPLFPCRKSPPNRLNTFTIAQVCWFVVVWVFRVVVVLQTLPVYVSVPASGSPLPLLSIPVDSTMTRNLVESSIQQSKQQYTKFSPRKISHSKNDYCGGIAAHGSIRKTVRQLMQDIFQCNFQIFTHLANPTFLPPLPHTASYSSRTFLLRTLYYCSSKLMQ